MARKRPETAHAGLDRLAQELAAAKVAVRDAQGELHEAHAEIAALEERVREACGGGEATTSLPSDLALARQKAEQTGLALEGISRRVTRAEQERERFMAANSERLIEELGPASEAVVQELQQHAQALVAAHGRWHALSQSVSQFLAASGIVPLGNTPSDHCMASAVREVKHALGQDLVSPMPHLAHHRVQREDDRRKLQLKQERGIA